MSTDRRDDDNIDKYDASRAKQLPKRGPTMQHSTFGYATSSLDVEIFVNGSNHGECAVTMLANFGKCS